VLFASAAFSIVACKSGMKNDKMEDSMELKKDVDSAMMQMQSTPADSIHPMPADTMPK